MRKYLLPVAVCLLITVNSYAQKTMATFEFDNLVGWSMTANAPPNYALPVEIQNDVVVGVHTYLFQGPQMIQPKIDTYKGKIGLSAVHCGFFVELAKCLKPARTITIDLVYGEANQPLNISINGNTNFTQLSSGTQVVDKVTVTVPQLATAGNSAFEGQMVLKGKKLRSVYISSGIPTSEMYVDRIVVTR